MPFVNDRCHVGGLSPIILRTLSSCTTFPRNLANMQARILSAVFAAIVLDVSSGTVVFEFRAFL